MSDEKTSELVKYRRTISVRCTRIIEVVSSMPPDAKFHLSAEDMLEAQLLAGDVPAVIEGFRIVCVQEVK